MNVHGVALLLLVTISLDDPARAQTLSTVSEGEVASATSETEPLILQSKYAKWRNALPDDYPQVADYRRVFLLWATGAEEHWGRDPEWTAQQIINAFPYEEAPRFLIRDRDDI